MLAFSTICGSLALQGQTVGTQSGKREVRHRSCGEQNLGLLYKLKGEKGRGRTKVTQKASPVWPLASGAPSGFSLRQERGRERLLVFSNIYGRPRASYPETVLEGVWFSLLCSARQSGFRILWLSLKRLLIAWLIECTWEGQPETPGWGGVPYANPLG